MTFGYVKISLYYSFYLLEYLFIYWLHWVLIAAWVFSSCGDLGLLSAVHGLLIVVHGLFIVMASLVALHGL